MLISRSRTVIARFLKQYCFKVGRVESSRCTVVVKSSRRTIRRIFLPSFFFFSKGGTKKGRRYYPVIEEEEGGARFAEREIGKADPNATGCTVVCAA